MFNIYNMWCFFNRIRGTSLFYSQNCDLSDHLIFQTYLFLWKVNSYYTLSPLQNETISKMLYKNHIPHYNKQIKATIAIYPKAIKTESFPKARDPVLVCTEHKYALVFHCMLTESHVLQRLWNWTSLLLTCVVSWQREASVGRL